MLATLIGGSYLIVEGIRWRIEQRLENALGRPIELGHFRYLSPRGIHLGKTQIPPTASDPSAVVVDGVLLNLDRRSWQWGQLPKATITLVRPHLAVVQRADGTWPARSPSSPPGQPDPKAGSGSITHYLATLRIEEGRLTLTSQVPERAAQPLYMDNINGSVRLAQTLADQPLAVDLSGQLGQGHFSLAGGLGATDGRGQRQVKVNAQGANLPMTAINWVLPAPLLLTNGVLNGSLALTLPLTPTNQPEIGQLDVQGMVIAQAGEGQLGQVAEPLNWRSTLWFQGQQLTLHDTQLNLGDLALTVEGTAGFDTGYHLVAQVPTVNAETLEQLVEQPLPLEPGQTFEGALRVTGPWPDPQVALWSRGAPPAGSLALPLDLNFIATALGMRMQGLPLRQRVALIEGATYTFRGDGAWFTLRDGTVVPPLSERAYNLARSRFATTLSPALDRKFFWFLQTSPYLTAIAADLEKGKLNAYRRGNRFDTDSFFVDYFLPIYLESSRAAGLDPGESLWMLDHSLRTLADPLLRTPQAKPITSGSGVVGSFWRDEQDLSMKQLVLRPFFAETGNLGRLLRFAVVKHVNRSTKLANRRLSSTPELLSKLPNVTFGAEEGAIALALGIAQFPSEGIYDPTVQDLAQRIIANERQKQVLRVHLTEQIRQLAAQHSQPLALALAEAIATNDPSLGFGADLSPPVAAQLHGGNPLSVMVSRSEKAGYPLAAAYANGRALLLEWLAGEAQPEATEDILFAVLKGYGLEADVWDWLAQQVPRVAPQAQAISRSIDTYHQLAQEGAILHEAFYAAMVQSDEDIGVSATIKQAIGFQAHLGSVLDQALAPADPYDPRYIAFRRSLAIYLREAPDISVYGGTPAALRAYAQETLNVQELMAVDLAAAPRVPALAALYTEARAHQMIDEWDVPGFQRLMLLGAMLAAGVDRAELPPALRSIGFPSEPFRHHLLFAVGVEGVNIEATRLGIQAHDHRVSFQPIALPGYRDPTFNGVEATACPARPTLAAIALGPRTQFIWDPPSQRVWLQRATVSCYLDAGWTEMTFPALLETVPIIHSEAGRDLLQRKLEEAQRLEAGIF